jgi:TP901 family phage tail tape measure protein
MAFDIESEILVTVSGEKSLNQLAKALENAGVGAEDVETAISLAAEEMVRAGQATDQYAKAVKQLAASYRELSKYDGRVALSGLDSKTSGDVKASAADLNAGDAAQRKLALQQERQLAAVVKETAKAEREKEMAARRANTESARTAKEAQRAERSLQAAQERTVNETINARYALYDTAAAYTSIAIAAGAVQAVTMGVYASQEQAFSSVRRTTGAAGEELEILQKRLLDLSAQIPATFGDISQVATIGAQLGVANDDLAEFTKTVSMFSAATGETVDNTAMMIGRIAQLTGTAGSDYERLASTIYQTGVTAVATEGEILAVASEIATAGDLAGFSADQVVALSSSLASLGIAPEGARGSIMRLFGEFDKAITNGGVKLDNFARISGATVEEFATMWQSSPQEALTSFLRGLEAINDAGGSLKSTLREVGIVNVRDEKLVSLLANNMEVYATAIDETSNAWARGTDLSKGFSTQTDNLLDQFQILKNNVTALTGSMSGGLASALLDTVKFGIKVLETLRGLADQFPVVATAIGAVVTGLTAALGIAATYRVAVSLLQGNLAALATAKYKLAGSSQGLNLKLGALVKTYAQVMMGNQAATARVLGLNKALDAQGVAAGKATASMQVNGAATRSAGASLAKMAPSLIKGATGFGLLLVAIDALTVGWDKFQYSMMSGSDKFRDQFGDTSGLADAIAKDTAAVAEGAEFYRKITVTAKEATSANSDYADSGVGIESMQNLIKQGVDSTNASVSTQTKYLGDNAAAWITQTMTANEEFRTLWRENGEALTQAGFSLDMYFKKLMDGTANDYLANFVAKQKTELDGASVAWDEYSNQIQSSVEVNEQESKAALDRYDAANSTSKALGALTEIQKHLNEAIQEEALTSEIATAATKALGAEVNNTEEGMKSFSETLEDSIKDMYAMYDAPAAVQAALENLGKSLYENGDAFSQYSEAGRANMAALSQTVNAMAAQAGDDNAVFVQGLINMIAALQAQGVVMGEEFDWVFGILSQAAGSTYGVNFSTKAARENIRKLLADHSAMVAILSERRAAAVEAATDDSLSESSRNMAKQAAAAFSSQLSAAEASASAMKNLSTEGDSVFNAVEGIARGFNNAAKSAAKTASNTKKAGKAANEAAKEIRTLSEYANDVSGAFSRAIELRFGVKNAKQDVKDAIKEITGGIEDADWPSIDEMLMSTKKLRKTFAQKEAKDAIGSMFSTLVKEAQAARDAVRDVQLAIGDLQAEMSQLKADEGSLKFWRTIAVQAGNLERVAQIDAELAENRAKQASVSAELADSERELAAAREAANNKSLTEKSDQGRTNRANIRGLVQEYLEWIQVLKDSGATQKQIDSAVADASKDFLTQAKALGFSSKELENYNAAILAAKKPGEEAAMTSAEVGAALQDVAELYGATAEEMLAAGYSQDQVNKYLDEGKKKIAELGKELGATPAQVKTAKGALDDFKTIINGLPKNVNVSIKALTPGEAAVKEFLAKYNNKTVNVKAQGTGNLQAPAGGWKTSPLGNVTANNLTAKNVSTTDKQIDIKKVVGLAVDATNKAKNKKMSIKEMVAAKASLSKKFQNLGVPKATADRLAAKSLGLSGRLSASSASIAGAISGKNIKVSGAIAGANFGVPPGRRWGGLGDPSANMTYMAKGGSPIRGASRGRDTVPAMLDPKEFVQPREAVSWYGLDFMEAIQNRSFPREFQIPIISAPAPQKTDGIQLVEILPHQLTQLATQIAGAMPAGITPSDITHAVNTVNAGMIGKGKG